MRALYATLRHRPAPLAGIFVALTMTAMFLTWAITLGGAASATIVPAQRLASAAIVVQGNPTVQEISGSGPSASVDSKPLTSYREVPASLITRLAALPGVRAAVADQSVPVALQLPGHRIVTGTSAGSLVGYGWQSAILTPFRLVAGHAPEGPDQVVLAAGVASAAGLSVGDQVRLTGQARPPLTVAGIAAAAAGVPAGGWAVFFSSQQAAVLSGHPGQADLIGIVAQPGAAAAGLAARVRAIVAGRQLSVLTGNSRGTAEELGATDELSQLSDIADTNGGINVYVSLFVAASVVALSVAERSRIWALLLAVGATPGQVRRAVMSELAVLGALAGPAGYLPGVWLASFTVRGLAAHQLVPAATRISPHPVVILAASGVAIGIAEIAGLLAAFRASRTRPTVALGEAAVELRTIGPLRRVMGAVALAAGVVLAIRALTLSSASLHIPQAEMVILPFIAAIAFAGPFLVSRAERLLSRPLRMLGGIAGGLAGAELRVRPRRVSAAAAAIAMSVAYLGAISVINATSAHAGAVQGSRRLAASAVVSATGPGLAPSVLPEIRRQPGTGDAIGLAATTVYLLDGPSVESTPAEAVTPGPLSGLLRLGVTSGSLQGFGPGDIALSRIAAGEGAAPAGVGQTITAYLADGTPYRAKVTAIYSQSAGFADVIIPTAAAGGGHLGASTLSQVLVGAASGTSQAALAERIAPLSARYPGLQVASRSVANAQAEQITSDDSYEDNLSLSLIALLVGVAVINTLVIATLQRRGEIAVLSRVGATMRQLTATAACQAGAVTLIGFVLGAVAQVVSVVIVSQELTGSLPYVPVLTVITVLGLVASIATMAILAPTLRMITKEEGRRN